MGRSKMKRVPLTESWKMPNIIRWGINGAIFFAKLKAKNQLRPIDPKITVLTMSLCFLEKILPLEALMVLLRPNSRMFPLAKIRRRIMEETIPPTKAPIKGSPKKSLKTNSDRRVIKKSRATFKRMERLFFEMIKVFLLLLSISKGTQKINGFRELKRKNVPKLLLCK